MAVQAVLDYTAWVAEQWLQAIDSIFESEFRDLSDLIEIIFDIFRVETA